MDPVQRSLKNPSDYDRPFDADAVIAEVKESVKDRETRDMMISEVDSLRERKQALTIANVVDDARALKLELSHTLDPALYEFGIAAHLGADLLASHLILRVNKG